ncbi:MAG TPA: hybrid sensor histidine kinase/response regulator [Ginsengibacter sp.]
MISKLRILILEDNQNDADLLNHELNKSGLSFASETVQTRKKFEHALEHFAPDLIISDYSLPSFDAVTAFDIKQNKFPHIPFIIVSGIIGEENAVELIKKGVTDYAPKDKLFTLPQKINRALKETEERKEKEIIAEKLKTQAAALIVANDDLLRLNQHLEERVFERTCALENLNHELKSLSLSKDKLLSVISHDLRNPLTALLLASDILSHEMEDEIFKMVQPFAKIINQSSHNILDQLNELVDWAITQQEKTILNAERLHLAGTINQSFELIKVNATQKNIVLENKVPDDIYVKADALMLRSILQNLVTNAIKFSAEGGLVSVMAELKDNMVEIGIIDRGIGMDANFSANLFQEFNTATAPGTNNEKGSGIGLKLVKDFVTQNCGTLRVESKIKKGTSILFTLPAA